MAKSPSELKTGRITPLWISIERRVVAFIFCVIFIFLLLVQGFDSSLPYFVNILVVGIGLICSLMLLWNMNSRVSEWIIKSATTFLLLFLLYNLIWNHLLNGLSSLLIFAAFLAPIYFEKPMEAAEASKQTSHSWINIERRIAGLIFFIYILLYLISHGGSDLSWYTIIWLSVGLLCPLLMMIRIQSGTSLAVVKVASGVMFFIIASLVGILNPSSLSFLFVTALLIAPALSIRVPPVKIS